jgi:anaerobic magnesium-protoporphyrin IX monomethyl ester cyclase
LILLIAPHSKSVYQDLTELTAVEPPIWAGLLQSALASRSCQTRFIDQAALGWSHEELIGEIKDLRPSLVVLVVYGHQPSASTQTMHAASEVLELMTSCELTYPVVLVGGHVSALPTQTLEKETYPHLMVAKGEGLNPVGALAKGTNPHSIPGLYMKGHTPKHEDSRALNLDITFPGINWDHLKKHTYRAHNWHVLEKPETINSYASIYTSLGCPFKCSFCCINAPFDSNSFRYWSPKFTVDQIEKLYKVYGIQNLKIADEMFVLRESHFLEICKGLIERNVKTNIWAYARVDTVKPHYLETLKKAGVNWLALGIESGSQYVRDGVTKGRFQMEDIYKTVKTIKDHGIHIIGNYIFGLPDDSEESMKQTLDLALELNCEFANFYSAMAYPGSPLHSVTPKEDLPETYLGYSQHSYETKPLRTKTVSAARVLEIRDSAHKTYFTSPSYLSLVKSKFGEPGLKLIESMNQKEIKRKLYG